MLSTVDTSVFMQVSPGSSTLNGQAATPHERNTQQLELYSAWRIYCSKECDRLTVKRLIYDQSTVDYAILVLYHVTWLMVNV